mgnify:CR=1 FL=1
MRSFFSLLFPSILTGIAVGLGAVVFLWLIDTVLSLFYGSGSFAANIRELPEWRRVLTPAVGGFFVGLLVMVLKRTDIAGEGVPQVLEAVESNRSRMQLFVAPLKILTTAITLGSGGSAGKEGPIVQIGSTLGATMGSWFKRNEHDRKILIAAGAAAGIAGVFNAPIAGVIFSIELITRKFNISHTLTIALAAIIANIVTRYSGVKAISIPLNVIPSTDWQALVLSIPLGLIAGVLAIIFGFCLYLFTVLFHHYKVPAFVPTTIGGFMVGCIGLFIPYIHEPMMMPLIAEMLSLNNLSILFIASVLFAKILATGLTLGSGSSGGVFAPALLIGTLLGALYATFIALFGFGDAAMTTTFILIGMGSFFAGITHAPITAIIILVELTKEPLVLPAVAIGTFVAYLTAKTIHKDSVYTEHLNRNVGYFKIK